LESFSGKILIEGFRKTKDEFGVLGKG